MSSGTGWYLLGLNFAILAVIAYVLSESLSELRLLRVRHCAAIIGLVGLAFLLRAVTASFGPGDIQMNLMDVFNPGGFDGTLDQFRGNAPIAFYRMLFFWLPAHYRTLAWGNIVFGSALTAIFVLWLIRLSFDRTAAVIAGALFGALPLLVHYSGTCNRQMFLLFFLLVGLWSLSRFLAEGHIRHLAISVVAMLIGIQTRTDGTLGLAFWVLQALLFLPPGRPARTRLGIACLLLFSGFGLYFLLFPGFGELLFRTAEMRSPLPFTHLRTIALSTNYTPWPLIALGLLGLLRGATAINRSRQIGFAALAAVVCIYAYAAIPTYPEVLTDARYQVVIYLFLGLLAAAGVELIASLSATISHRKPAAVLLACLIAASYADYSYLLMPYTIDEEYRFIEEGMKQLPPDADIYYSYTFFPNMPDQTENPGELELFPPVHLVDMLGLQQRWLPWPPVDSSGGRPRYYYHMASCSAGLFDKVSGQLSAPFLPVKDPRQQTDYVAHRNRCREALRRHGHRPVLERELPGRSYSPSLYENEKVTVGFYEMGAEDTAEADESMGTGVPGPDVTPPRPAPAPR